jgi:hypothetical protein
MMIEIDQETGAISIMDTILNATLNLEVFENSIEFSLWRKLSLPEYFPLTYMREFVDQNNDRAKVWITISQRKRLKSVTL